MQRRFATGLAAAVAAIALSPVAARAADPKKVASVEGITEYRLDNGLRVLLFPDPSRSKVTVNLTVFVGSRHEGYGEAGMAHLLEHMVFKGTPDHPDIVGDLKERGAQFNGSTWVDRTNYYETLPASDDNLEYAIAMEADRMVNSPIKAEDLSTEFSVVRNEFERGENSPSRVLNQRMMAAAYEWHNYGKSTIGNRADIERVPVDNLRAFYKKYYRPENAMLVVAGRFEEKEALKLVEKYFGALKNPAEKLPETYTEEPPQDGERNVTLRRVGDVGIVGLMYHVPAASHPEFPALKVLADVLSTEPSGRLYKALVEPGKAASVGASPLPTRDPGVFEIEAEVNTKDAAELQAVRQTILDQLEKVKAEGVKAEEVERAKRQYVKQRELSQADTSRIAVQLSEWGAQGDWRLYFLDRDRMEKVTPEQVQEVAKKYLEASNRTTGYFIPSDAPSRTPVPQAPAIADLVDGYEGRSVASAGEVFDPSPEAIQARVQTPEKIEGVEVALLPKKTRGESVVLNLRLHFGDEESLKGRTEAADFLGDLMTRGTKSLDRQALQDELDRNVARLNSSGSAGTLTFSVQTKRDNLPAVIDILRQVLREPSLPADEFETLKNEQIARIEQGKSEPTVLAVNRLQRVLSPYPKDDVRYVPTIEENLERLKALKIDDIRSLYRDFIGASHGELSVVGDFEPSEILPKLEEALAGWESSKPYERIENPYRDDIAAGRETILTPDKANAIYFAAVTLPLRDDDPQYPALSMANFILGGGTLSSRLGDRLRQKEGLSYGAGSNLMATAPDNRGVLMINAIYNPNNVAKVVAGVDEELARFLKDGVTEEELAKAKAGWLRQREIRRTTDPALAGMLSQNLFLDRDMTYESDLEAKVKALTVDDVNKAVREHINPEKLTVITAGDFKEGKAEEKKADEER